MADREHIGLNVNGQEVEVEGPSGRTLLEALREDLGLTGTKYGCGEGACGACVVLVNGRRVQSCGVPVGSVRGKEVLTIEGLAEGGRLHPVQVAFLAEAGFQCGYCTPGMILSTVALLRRNAAPSDDEIVEWMNEQVCRCCGYERIVAAVRRAAAEKEAARDE